MDEKSLSHTSWNCKYHIVLVPKRSANPAFSRGVMIYPEELLFLLFVLAVEEEGGNGGHGKHDHRPCVHEVHQRLLQAVDEGRPAVAERAGQAGEEIF